MTNPKTMLQQLHKNLNILQEREAKYGGSAPLELLNQITDHQAAIALTEQRLNGQVSETDWYEALKPLLLAIKEGQVVNVEAETSIAGDVQGDLISGDKVAGDTDLFPFKPEASDRPLIGINIKPGLITWWLKRASKVPVT